MSHAGGSRGQVYGAGWGMQRCHVDAYPRQGGKHPLAPPSKGPGHPHLEDGGIPTMGSKAPPYRGLGTPPLGTAASLRQGLGNLCTGHQGVTPLWTGVSPHQRLACPHTGDWGIPTPATRASSHWGPGCPHTEDWSIPTLGPGHPHPGHQDIPTLGTRTSPGGFPAPSQHCAAAPGLGLAIPVHRDAGGTAVAHTAPCGWHCPAASSQKSGWGSQNTRC